jgi:hypothetical protein
MKVECSFDNEGEPGWPSHGRIKHKVAGSDDRRASCGVPQIGDGHPLLELNFKLIRRGKGSLCANKFIFRVPHRSGIRKPKGIGLAAV